ncbi:MAG: hypothetical protein P9M03_11485 [Candidatus Theseobacter exili]|nr:hypothetical protein [Candidatus Theseobacter exili]
MEDYMIGIIILIGILVIVVFLVWIAVMIIDEVLTVKRIKNFEKNLKKSIKHCQPSLKEIEILASTKGINQSEIQYVFKEILREIFIGNNMNLEPYKQNLLSYLDQYKREEPFNGIPNEIRTQLEKLREKLNGDAIILEPLTEKIKDLLLINKRKAKRERIISISSLIVGIISLFFAFVMTIIYYR